MSLFRKLCALICAPRPVTKTRIGQYVYWTDQYGRVIREVAND